jgi:hypothetical protein
MRIATQVATVLLAAAAGVVSGVCAVAFHSESWGWWLAVVGLSAAVLALRGWARVGLTLGWLGVVFVAVLGRSEGDWAIGSDAAGYGLLAVALLHLGFTMATLPVRRPGPEAPSA